LREGRGKTPQTDQVFKVKAEENHLRLPSWNFRNKNRKQVLKGPRKEKRIKPRKERGLVFA